MIASRRGSVCGQQLVQPNEMKIIARYDDFE